MKLGSAKKWIDLLKSGNYKTYNQMHVHRDSYQDGIVYHSALGALADFLNSDAWEGWKTTLMYDKWNGESFYLPKEFTKSAKMKTTDASFIPENGDNYAQSLRDYKWNDGRVSICDISNYHYLYGEITNYDHQIMYIEKYYDQM